VLTAQAQAQTLIKAGTPGQLIEIVAAIGFL
jgi:hypothetical protein